MHGKGHRRALQGALAPHLCLSRRALPALPSRGKHKEGRRVLERLRGTTDVDAEYADICEAADVAAKVSLAQVGLGGTGAGRVGQPGGRVSLLMGAMAWQRVWERWLRAVGLALPSAVGSAGTSSCTDCDIIKATQGAVAQLPCCPMQSWSNLLHRQYLVRGQAVVLGGVVRGL